MNKVWVYLCLFVYFRRILVSCIFLDYFDFEKRFGFMPIWCTKFYEIPPEELTKVRILVMRTDFEFTAYCLHKTALLLTDLHFNESRKTVVFSHGFTQNSTVCPTHLVTKAYLALGDTNVLMLDSYPLLENDYVKSVAAVAEIGRALGDQLFKMTELGLNYTNTVLVGHSLGAHIVGFAGKQFKKRFGKKLPTTVGLDPAGPCFLNVHHTERLDKTDAEFVQIIHTNGAFLGMMKPIGHLDFYPNGGQIQPTELFNIPNLYLSHERSVELWYESILHSDKFVGTECFTDLEIDMHDCQKIGRRLEVLGPKANREARGMFYLRTTSRRPFYLEESISN